MKATRGGAIKLFSLRPFIYSFCLSIVLFGLLMLGLRGVGYSIPGSLSNGSLSDMALAVLFLLVVFLVIFTVSFLLFAHGARAVIYLNRFDPLKKVSISLKKKGRGFWLCWAFIFICWVPWIALAYPVDMNADTLNQLWQYNTPAPTWYSTMNVMLDAEMVDHHAFFDTLIYGLFLDLGDALGSQNAGLFIFSVLQSLAASGALAFACCYLDRLNVPKILRIGALLFVALFPPFAQFAATMLKDSLFMIVFLLYFIGILEIYRTKGSIITKARFLAPFLALVVLCVLTKKTGIYIVGLPGIVLLAAYRAYFRHFLVVLVTPFLLSFVIVPLVLYPIVQVAPGGKQEMLAPLFQQTAAFFIKHPSEVMDDEYEVVEKILKPDLFEKKYKKTTVDPVKNTFDYYASSEDIFAYLRVWVSQGLRHPETYLQATFGINARLIAPIAIIDNYAGLSYEESYYNSFYKNQGDANLIFYKPEEVKQLASEVKKAYSALLTSNSLFTILCSRGLWGCWAPLTCALLCFFFRKDSLIVFAPILVSVLILFISPAASSRYIMPILYAMPLVIGFTIQRMQLYSGIKKTKS